MVLATNVEQSLRPKVDGNSLVVQFWKKSCKIPWTVKASIEFTRGSTLTGVCSPDPSTRKIWHARYNACPAVVNGALGRQRHACSTRHGPSRSTA